MPKYRYIIRYRGSGAIPAKDLDRIKSSKHVEVVDETSRMLLVEAAKNDVERVVNPNDEWIIVKEKTLRLPDSVPKVKKKVEP